MVKRHVHETLKTSFRDSGRCAGTGINEESYDEDSGPGAKLCHYKKPQPRPTKLPPPAPVVMYKLSEDELRKYKGNMGVE